MSGSDSQVIDGLARLYARLDQLAPPVELGEVLTDGPSEPDGGLATRASSTQYRRRRQVVGLAAAVVALGGGVALWWATTRGPMTQAPMTVVPAESGPSVSAGLPTTTPTGSVVPTPIGVDSGPTPSDGDATESSPVRSIVDEVASADAWYAAQLFWPEAAYRASPAEAADLVIANELRSRACYESVGVELPPFDANRLAEWKRYEEQRWERLRAWWTPAGQERLRREGAGAAIVRQGQEPVAYPHMTAPSPERCYPAATGVTYLGSSTVWSEDQLGTNGFDDPDWAPLNWGFGRLPGTEDVAAASDACIVGRGWSEWGEPGAYQEYWYQPEASTEEIELVNDILDCRNQFDAASVYLGASQVYTEGFRATFADQLDQIERERADALDEAYTVLRAAGFDPLSD